MSPSNHQARDTNSVPPCLCVLLELILKHRLADPEDILALGMAHPNDYVAIVDSCELAIDSLEPCDKNLPTHCALTEQIEKCRRVIR